MNNQIRKQLKKVFLDLENDLKKFEEIYKDIEEYLSNNTNGWINLSDHRKKRMVLYIMRRATNDTGMCYTDHPVVWTNIEDMVFMDLLLKIQNLLVVIDSYNKNHQTSKE